MVLLLFQEKKKTRSNLQNVPMNSPLSSFIHLLSVYAVMMHDAMLAL